MKISLCIPVYEFAPPSPPRFWPILPLGIMICQNLYLLYLMLPRKVSSLLAECVLERRYLKTFLNIVLCINSNPLFWLRPNLTPWDHNFINLYLFYLTILPQKLKLFMGIGFLEEFLKYCQGFNNSKSPLKRAWSLIFRNLSQLIMLCAILFGNGSAGFKEDHGKYE